MSPKQYAIRDIGQDAEMRPVLILIEDEIIEFLSGNVEQLIPIEV
jgi:hypothetical protein